MQESQNQSVFFSWCSTRNFFLWKSQRKKCVVWRWVAGGQTESCMLGVVWTPGSFQLNSTKTDKSSHLTISEFAEFFSTCSLICLMEKSAILWPYSYYFPKYWRFRDPTRDLRFAWNRTLVYCSWLQVAIKDPIVRDVSNNYNNTKWSILAIILPTK